MGRTDACCSSDVLSCQRFEEFSGAFRATFGGRAEFGLQPVQIRALFDMDSDEEVPMDNLEMDDADMDIDAAGLPEGVQKEIIKELRLLGQSFLLISSHNSNSFTFSVQGFGQKAIKTGVVPLPMLALRTWPVGLCKLNPCSKPYARWWFPVLCSSTVSHGVPIRYLPISKNGRSQSGPYNSHSVRSLW